MNMDPPVRGIDVVCVDNCSKVEEVAGADIVNLDANFVIPPEEQGKDLSFPRLKQALDMVRVAEKNQSLVSYDDIPKSALGARPYRPPDYAEEWKLLRKAWTLTRNKQAKLVRNRLKDATKIYYRNDPLKSIDDWCWRFSFFLSQPEYEEVFLETFKEYEKLKGTGGLQEFVDYFEETASLRGARYLSVFSDFFANYSEFGQVFFFVVRGLPVPAGHHTSSVDFDSVRMFYGNAFEQFTSLTDHLALANNLLRGRGFKEFDKLSIEEYYKLDKAPRLGPLENNPAFSKLCAETDNQLRNASHHGSFEFDPENQTIRFRSGKGAQGAEHSLSYAEYLGRCVKLLLQLTTLFRVELMLTHLMRARAPI